ncbi:MAG: Fe-S cluster assembly sulfur transfer protein SufU [Acidimicrobiales bacterium]
MPGLEDLYREIILDHYRNPRNRGSLEAPPAVRVEGFNPLCGDEVVLYLDIEDGTVADVKVGGQGCSISQSSASLMSASVKGKTVAEARGLIRTFKSMMSIHEANLDGSEEGESGADAGADGGPPPSGEDALRDLGELAALQGVVQFPVRIKCATLSWNALAQGLDQAAG